MSSNLPPGCSNHDIEVAAGAYSVCECCGHGVEDCICPECPICEAVGEPKCYLTVSLTEPGKAHGLIYNAEQLAGQARYKEFIAKENEATEALAKELEADAISVSINKLGYD